MKKVLFVATVVKTHIKVFHLPFLKEFKSKGYETYVCAKNDYPIGEECNIPNCDNFYNIPFNRNPFSIFNVKAYIMLKKIIIANDFDIIHCHTPVGGVLTRLVKRSQPSIRAKVIYTAHGFHFFKGSSVFSWAFYYPIERWLSRYTDILITLNYEDYLIAKKFKLTRVELMNGVGIDISKYAKSIVPTQRKREELHIKEGSMVLLSVGELIKRKNHECVIRAIAKLNNANFIYLICGSGSLERYLHKLIRKLDLEEQVLLLGFRKDIPDLLHIADVFIFPSLQEGLPVALMEAMASSLPIISSNIRGNRDLLENNVGGILVLGKSVERYQEAISFIAENPELKKSMGERNYKKIQRYAIENIIKEMNKIYFDESGEV